MLELEQKKGDPNLLDGRVTVYAVIQIDQSDLAMLKHPVAGMIHNGLLVAQGNFRDQSTLKDFLKSELGISLDDGLGEGLAQLLEKMDGLESALDPQKLRDRLENMDELEDFIPTPAKITPFSSEDEILEQEGDVFFVGIYKNIGNAVLSINAVPILYQARYREQESQRVRNEIESLISQIEKNDLPGPGYASAVNVDEKILKEFIPAMLYAKKDHEAFAKAQSQFHIFMSGYQFQEDIDAIVTIIGGPEDLTPREFKLLELYAKKISAVKNEDFNAAENVRKEIDRLRDHQ